MNSIKSFWVNLGVVVASLILGYLMMEAGYRMYAKKVAESSLVAQLTPSFNTQKDDDPLDLNSKVEDIYTGWRYIANLKNRKKDHPWNSTWSTNSHGHVSSEEYPVTKPVNEFRVGVFGDSFTANTLNNFRWTELLQAKLNTSSEWRTSVSGKKTRVINFGIGGQGVVQMSRVAEFHSQNFGLDLAIVNIISDNILRKTYKRGLPTFKTVAERDKSIREYIQAVYLSKISWWTLRPELFVATVGRYFGLKPSLPSNLTAAAYINSETRYDRENGIKHSREALIRIRTIYPNFIVLWNPMYEELVYELLAKQYVKAWDKLVEDMVAGTNGLEVWDMSHYLPLPSSHAELTKWFYIPFDKHYSDRGIQIYASAVADLLIKDFTTKGKPRFAGAIVNDSTVANGSTQGKKISISAQ